MASRVFRYNEQELAQAALTYPLCPCPASMLLTLAYGLGVVSETRMVVNIGNVIEAKMSGAVLAGSRTAEQRWFVTVSDAAGPM